MKPAMPYFRLAAVALFSLACAAVWLPFNVHNVAFSTGLDRARPAGRLVTGFVVEENLPALGAWTDSIDDANCIALRFATYRRVAAGSIEVFLQQGERGHRWQVDASKLNDNEYLDLCKEEGIDADQPSRLRVSGISGSPGSSATVWMTAANGRSVLINGERRRGTGLAFRLSREKQIAAHDILRIQGGAFTAGFILLWAIGLLALLFFPPSAHRQQAT